MRQFFYKIMIAIFLTWASNAQADDTDLNVLSGHLTVSNIVSGLQSNGFQAVVTPPQNSQIKNALATITTGVGGVKIGILVQKCNNATNDDVCILTLVANFTDERNLINDHSLVILNQKTQILKMVPWSKPDGNKGLSAQYNFICKDADNTKFIPTILTTFGAEVSAALNVLNTQIANGSAGN